MFISDFAIKRPLVTVVSMVALVVFGLFAFWQLQTDEFPDVAPPYVVTTVIYPGASPEQVEREILEPVEEAIQGISGVDKVYGEARDGYASIITAFVFEKPLQEATQDIRDAISLRRADLPQEMEEPILRRLSPNDRPIIILGLSSETLAPNQLTRVADPTITRELRSITGVAQVDVVGKLERELTVELKPQALAASGVSVGEVVQALQLQNLAVPVGRVEGSLDERSIRLKGRLENPQEFAQLVVSERNGQLVRLGQVADVKDGTEEQRTLAILDGKEAIGITLTKAKGYSTTDVSTRVQKKVAELVERKVLPPGVNLKVINDAGVRVDASVDNVVWALIEGALLTVFVVFLFLNSWRSTVITGLALPVSVLASFIAVWIFGFTLNTMSLLGLSLAIGILIDDAIVVRENIVRHVEMGKDHFTAAREGTDEIGLAVAATTFSIVAVFVPVAFMYGEAGMWFKPFALTIACSVLVSLFVSFSLDPMLSAYWPDPHVPEHEKSFITKALDRFNGWFNRLAERYRGVIAWALDHRWAMMGLATATFVLALAMPALGWVGGGFFPGDDRSEMYIGIETPPGSNLDYTRLKAEEAAKIARNHPEVLYTFTTLGGQSGAVDEGNIYVRLKPKHDRTIGAEDFAAMVREEVKQVGGATLAVFTSDFQGDQKQIQVQVRGTETEAIQQVAERIRAELAKVPGAVDVGLSSKGQKPELEVEVNRGLAGQLGVSVGQVAQSLRPAFAGIDAGDWVDPSGETRDVTVRVSPESRARASDLQ
jgi:hydrophobic/amphiphilic exporter-1 (mainly G- bacteria), HAE1 family